MKTVCNELTQAVERGGMHAFYANLPKLGVHVYGKTKQVEEAHTLDDIADFSNGLYQILYK